jgi:plasmid stability protein
MAKTTVELPERLHRTLRVKAALENVSMNAIMLAALEHYLEHFRLEPDLLQIETVPHDQKGDEQHANGTHRHHG